MGRQLVTTDWTEAGRAWGARATDWAYFFEQYARPANEVLFERLGVGHGTRLLDVACGSGLAVNYADRRGAHVSGLDASETLVGIAAARTPDADLRVGDMFALPFADASFDVVTSFNGIWKGCDAALDEVRRVLVPGGKIGLTFWGRLDHLGLMPYFLKLIELSPPSHREATVEQGDTGRAGVIDAMLRATGFEILERGHVPVVNEWPTVDVAVRALAAAGPAFPAIETIGIDAFRDALREVVEPMLVQGLGIRIRSELGWITAQTRTA
jgi:ubiquinone/menaquinone biosynthesis C-methylase UbiE